MPGAEGEVGVESWQLQPRLQVATDLRVAFRGHRFRGFPTKNSCASLDLGPPKSGARLFPFRLRSPEEQMAFSGGPGLFPQVLSPRGINISDFIATRVSQDK